MISLFRSKLAKAIDDYRAERALIGKIDARVRFALARERYDAKSKINATEHTEIKVVGSVGHAVTDRVEFNMPKPTFDNGGYHVAPLLPGERWAAGPAMRDLMKTTAMPSWREIKTEEEKPVDFTISMFELSLLAWRASHGTTPYPRGPGLGNPATVTSTLKKLEVKGLIKFGSETNDYTLTPRAECLIEAMVSLPLPVKQDPPWTMPGK